MQSGNLQKPKLPAIPLDQFLQFKGASDRAETEMLNGLVVQKEMDEEKKRVYRLMHRGSLRRGNGLEYFIHACKRRLSIPWCFRTEEHSERVRRFSCCIAKGSDPEIYRIIMMISGYHDIGKTLIAQYLVNREDGSVNGLGRGERINKGELSVLRHSHIDVGLDFFNLYAPFMSRAEAEHGSWIVGGHHMAHDGKGSASGFGYFPKIVIGSGFSNELIRGNIPISARIVRCADVYAAIMENRFYLEKSEGIINKAGETLADDAALGLLIAVAGVDVEPKMVGRIIMERYGVSSNEAAGLIKALQCSNSSLLEKRGSDIDFSIAHVLPEPRFRRLIALRNRLWDEPMDTAVLSFI